MLYLSNDISKLIQWILFMLDTVINHHSSFMHIKYALALYQNKVLMPIMHVRSKITLVNLVKKHYMAIFE